MFGTVLYYPTIDIKDEDWLKYFLYRLSMIYTYPHWLSIELKKWVLRNVNGGGF